MTRPNIVLLVMDTARARTVNPALGVEGIDSTSAPDLSDLMPNLSTLAAEGTTYTDAMANAPWTLPSHGTLFTGQHPSVHATHAARRRFDHEPTLPARLADAGYHTVGVSNNTWISGEFGFERGFAEFFATWQLFQDATDFGDVAQTRMGRLDQLRGILGKFRGNPVKNLANIVYGQFFRKRHDDGARRTNEHIREHLEGWLDHPDPLFLFVNYLEPHLEYRPPEAVAREWLPADATLEEARAVPQDAWAYVTGEIEMTDREFRLLRGLYRAELAYLDERIGDLLELFRDAGVAGETVFVVTSDHGENIGDHELMDHQYSLHETLLSVPLVVAGPGFESTTVSTPVQLADLYPTLLDVADADYDGDALAGQSLRGDVPADRPLFAEYLAPQPSIETLRDHYDCQRDVSVYDRRLRAVRRGGEKYVRGSDGTEWLFDLAADPTESENRIETDPDRRDALAGTLEEWVETLPAIEQADVAVDDRTQDRLEDLGYL